MSFLINPFAFLAAGGDFESIATVTVATPATISFTSIPQTYQHLQLRVIYRNGSTQNARARLALNGDTTNSSYRSHLLIGDGSSAGSGSEAGVNGNAGWVGMAAHTSSNLAANLYCAAVIDIIDYASTSKNKTVRLIDGVDGNGAGAIGLASILYLSTSAISSVRFSMDGGGDLGAGTTAALYGIRA